MPRRRGPAGILRHLEADRAALDALVADGEQPALLDAASATIVERLGDTVLISLGPDSEPASVLLMKGEAGWRVRDYLSQRQMPRFELA